MKSRPRFVTLCEHEVVGRAITDDATPGYAICHVERMCEVCYNAASRTTDHRGIWHALLYPSIARLYYRLREKSGTGRRSRRASARLVGNPVWGQVMGCPHFSITTL